MNIEEEYDPFLIGLIRHKIGRKKGKKRKFKHVLRDHFMPLPALMHRRRKERKRAKRAQAAKIQKLMKRPTIHSGVKRPMTLASKPKIETLKNANTTVPKEDQITKDSKKQLVISTQTAWIIGGGIVLGVLGGVVISKLSKSNNGRTS